LVHRRSLGDAGGTGGLLHRAPAGDARRICLLQPAGLCARRGRPAGVAHRAGSRSGCFNNLAKITRETIAAWASVLASVGGFQADREMPPDGGMQERGGSFMRLSRRMGSPMNGWRCGPVRRIATCWRNTVTSISCSTHSLIAAVLTTCEALWMGVPVVTMPGETFASRHSASHLANIGLPDWVARDPPQYLARSRVARANDLTALAVLRRGLRPRMKASPLCDAPRFGRHLGTALRQAWHDWCTPPKQIKVFLVLSSEKRTPALSL